MKKSPFVLIILDGFGYSPSKEYNAIAMAKTPVWDKLWSDNPHCLLTCSGLDVGLPQDQMGNSEVGHMNISAGRVIYQDITRIDLDIDSGNFFKNPVLINLLDNKKTLHVCGLISDGGVHSHLRHFIALVKLAKQYDLNLYIHAFLDGRDTPPKSALKYLLELDKILIDNNIGKIVSLIGRYYAMDRDKHWDRTQKAYDLLTNNLTIDNKNNFISPDITSALKAAYERGETDEFIKPTIIASNQEEYLKYQIKQNDNLLFMNFRADRARQLSHKFVDSKILNKLVTLTQYEKNLVSEDCVIYQPLVHNNMLGEFLSTCGRTQLRIAETEKYAHVTFFFNGGIEQAFPNEDRILIPSPKVSTFNLKPEMSAYELTAQLTKAIENNKYDAIICNYANPDMVGHTGDLSATIKAIETIDDCLGKVVSSINKSDGQLFITADHGNAECMYDENTKQAHTAHTHFTVPLVYYTGHDKKSAITIAQDGCLIDIAPTMLTLMGLTPPIEMTGRILFKLIN